MDKIRYNKDNVYRVEVNDDGEYIEFDLLDIELPLKCAKASEDFEKETEKYSSEIMLINKKYEGKDTNNLEYLVEISKANNEYCEKCRVIFDTFLGKGACMKIFGSTNRIGMFDEFFAQLQPLLENLRIDMDTIKNNILNKYKKDNGVM